MDTCHVLIVDDEVLVRQGIKHLLNWENEGFQIVGEASDGKEALELIERLQPHIVITDIVMPAMDGAELTSIVKARYPHIEMIILSSFGEFEYVRSTFQSGVADYILKPKLEADQLLAALKRAARKIPSLQLVGAGEDDAQKVKLIIDKLMAGYDTEVDRDAVSYIFPYNSFRLLGADLKLLPGKSMEQHSRTMWLERISAELDGIAEFAAYQPVPTDPNMVALLINMDSGEWQRLIAPVRNLAGWTAAKLPEVCWTVGDPFGSIGELYSHYQNSFMKLCAYRFYLPLGQNLIMRSELPKLAPQEPQFNMNHFTEQMSRNRFESALEELFQYVSAASAYYVTDVFAFKSFLGNIIFNITILLGRLQLETRPLEEAKYSYFKAINEAPHVSVAVRQLHAFIDEVNVALAMMKKQTSGNPNMTMLLAYIREHYAEPISLTEIANHFHFNPSYLSSFFASHNKEGFSEYLNRIRVEKAADLLQEADTSISEISGMVGYSDHSYFTKVFKKLMGVSPSQYRKQHLHTKRDLP